MDRIETEKIRGEYIESVKLQMDSAVMISIPTFIKFGSGIQIYRGGMHTDTPSNIKVLSQIFDRMQCRYY
jgi:hypothetical protein